MGCVTWCCTTPDRHDYQTTMPQLTPCRQANARNQSPRPGPRGFIGSVLTQSRANMQTVDGKPWQPADMGASACNACESGTSSPCLHGAHAYQLGMLRSCQCPHPQAIGVCQAAACHAEGERTGRAVGRHGLPVPADSTRCSCGGLCVTLLACGRGLHCCVVCRHTALSALAMCRHYLNSGVHEWHRKRAVLAVLPTRSSYS
jgi:hypothetical protein